MNAIRSTSTVTALLIFLMAGCDSSKNESEDATGQAGRETADAMAVEHAEDSTDPTAATEQQPARDVIGEDMPYTESDDKVVYGYFAAPADMFEPLPAVIMIHEWWGLNDNVRAMADRLAGEGYIVLAVDLYDGEVADSPEAARKLMLNVVEKPEASNDNIRSAYAFLKNTAGAPRIASLGWCFGGHWSLNTALLFPDELNASVIYYGQVTANEAMLEPLNVPLLGLFGADDRGITIESVEAFQTALENLGKNHDIQIYGGAGHAFANPTGNRYNAEAAEDAWRRTLAFLDFHLSVDGS